MVENTDDRQSINAELQTLEAICRMETVELLEAAESIAAQKRRNIELRRENARLSSRIAEEDTRLSHV